MTILLPDDFAMQSVEVEVVCGVPAGAGSTASLAAAGATLSCPGVVRVAVFKPDRHYLLAAGAVLVAAIAAILTCPTRALPIVRRNFDEFDGVSSAGRERILRRNALGLFPRIAAAHRRD